METVIEVPVFLLQNTCGSFDGNMNSNEAINIAGTASLTNLWMKYLANRL